MIWWVCPSLRKVAVTVVAVVAVVAVATVLKKSLPGPLSMWTSRVTRWKSPLILKK